MWNVLLFCSRTPYQPHVVGGRPEGPAADPLGNRKMASLTCEIHWSSVEPPHSVSACRRRMCNWYKDKCGELPVGCNCWSSLNTAGSFGSWSPSEVSMTTAFVYAPSATSALTRECLWSEPLLMYSSSSSSPSSSVGLVLLRGADEAVLDWAKLLALAHKDGMPKRRHSSHCLVTDAVIAFCLFRPPRLGAASTTRGNKNNLNRVSPVSVVCTSDGNVARVDPQTPRTPVAMCLDIPTRKLRTSCKEG